MLVNEIVSLPEEELERYYSTLTQDQKDNLILIEDSETEGNITISYAKDMSTEDISLMHLGLYASNWKKENVVRIDSWRFKCLQNSFEDTDATREAKKIFRKVLLYFKEDKKIDLLDYHLYYILDIIKELDDEVVGLFDINNEQHQELISLDEKYNPNDATSREPLSLNETSTLKILEPTQEATSELP